MHTNLPTSSEMLQQPVKQIQLMNLTCNEYYRGDHVIPLTPRSETFLTRGPPNASQQDSADPFPIYLA